MTPTAVVRLAEREDAGSLAQRLRQPDVNELTASCGNRPMQEILEECFDTSKVCFAVELENEVIALFGVAECEQDYRIGFPWMLASDDLYKIKSQFLRECRTWVNLLQDGFELLMNCVDERNTVSMRWLEWCGFKRTVLHPEYGAGKVPFWQYERRVNV